jgi:PAS domain S-box-containing protein
MSGHPQGPGSRDGPPPRSKARESLRWRVPIVIAAVIVVVVGTFLAVAYREVRTSLMQATEIRAQGAASQLASLLAQSAQQRLGELRQAATDVAVRGYLQSPDDVTRQAAQVQLSGLKSSNPQIIELWTNAGEKVLSLPLPANAIGSLPLGSRPSTTGVGQFQLFRNGVFTETVARVESAVSAGARESEPVHLGFVIVRRPIVAASAGDSLRRLLGNGAVLRVGNSRGNVWTDLSMAVDAPPVDLARVGVSRYQAVDGARHVGAMAAVGGTPWSVWIDFPEAVVLAPARSFLKRMLLVALGVVMVTGIGLRAMTERILTPLSELTQASEAMAGGAYSRRVTVTRRDEIGRLGAAFNVMTEGVERAHEDLEARVRQRTATVEETSAILTERLIELKDSREELDQFFSLAPDMMCIADIEGRFTRVNAAWNEALGWTAEDLTGASYVSFVHPDDAAATETEMAKFAGGGSTSTFENRYRCKDGSFRWLSWRAAPVLSRGLVYAAVRDVTEQKRIARDLEERAAELVAVNRELEAFSYSVSHDLRAPLRHIGGFAALLRESASASLDADGHRLLRTIVDAAAQMGRLIDDLLAFSRVGRTSLELGDVNLNAVVREAQQEIMTGINGHPIVWRLQDLPVVRGDRSMLRLVFVNLLSNAVKYSSTREEPEIEIGTMPGAADETVLFVRDNGVGFDMQYVAKLFGVFQRLHTADEFEGTGIGLANVRRIVHRLGGRVWAKAAVDDGAAFYVSLPNEPQPC